MVLDLPGTWLLQLVPTPVPECLATVSCPPVLPGGMLLRVLSRSWKRHSGHAFWHPSIEDGGWIIPRVSEDVLPLSPAPGSPLGPVLRRVAVRIGVRPGGRIVRAVLAAVPEDVHALAVSLSVMES